MKKINIFNKKKTKNIDNVTPIRPGITLAANDNSIKDNTAKAKWFAVTLLKGIYNILRSLTFIVMLWLRLPVRLLLILVSFMAFFGVIICLVAFSDRSMIPGFVIMGVITTALAWIYDVILIKLTPNIM
ncbi:hypothetical protein [Xenorhabdus sp. KK7.4]|uniref:hypothetical protein n=1 Tax=Xenorhabdus sp. KK7.4 TaxID=1851572 RepID=UPI000C050D1E|nr:hypothetical protein [Xenorhabdus sp. KK7.4]PHM51277.1 hypothetical protein Xekk_03850 [Xenorhabdus sp. KK7.4]